MPASSSPLLLTPIFSPLGVDCPRGIRQHLSPPFKPEALASAPLCKHVAHSNDREKAGEATTKPGINTLAISTHINHGTPPHHTTPHHTTPHHTIQNIKTLFQGERPAPTFPSVMRSLAPLPPPCLEARSAGRNGTLIRRAVATLSLEADSRLLTFTMPSWNRALASFRDMPGTYRITKKTRGALVGKVVRMVQA